MFQMFTRSIDKDSYLENSNTQAESKWDKIYPSHSLEPAKELKIRAPLVLDLEDGPVSSPTLFALEYTNWFEMTLHSGEIVRSYNPEVAVSIFLGACGPLLHSHKVRLRLNHTNIPLPFVGDMNTHYDLFDSTKHGFSKIHQVCRESLIKYINSQVQIWNRWQKEETDSNVSDNEGNDDHEEHQDQHSQHSQNDRSDIDYDDYDGSFTEKQNPFTNNPLPKRTLEETKHEAVPNSPVSSPNSSPRNKKIKTGESLTI